MKKFVRNSLAVGGLVLALALGRNEYTGSGTNNKGITGEQRDLAVSTLKTFGEGYNSDNRRQDIALWQDIKCDYAWGTLAESEIRHVLQKRLMGDLIKDWKDYRNYGRLYKQNWGHRVGINLLECFNANLEHGPLSYRGDPLI